MERIIILAKITILNIIIIILENIIIVLENIIILARITILKMIIIILENIIMILENIIIMLENIILTLENITSYSPHRCNTRSSYSWEAPVYAGAQRSWAGSAGMWGRWPGRELESKVMS